MGFTKAQAKKVDQIREIASLGGVDFWNLENQPDHDVRNVLLDICKDRLVRTTVLSNYLIIDEVLSELICQHFFGRKKTSIELWRTKRFQNFNYYVLEELSLLKKLALVKALERIPKPIEETIRHLNVLRNAVAHAFFPTNKREFRHRGMVTYKGKDVFTFEGLALLDADKDDVLAHLMPLAYGKRRRVSRRTKPRIRRRTSGAS
jgi:hypothetical protein